jgi:hypothetical protein
VKARLDGTCGGSSALGDLLNRHVGPVAQTTMRWSSDRCASPRSTSSRSVASMSIRAPDLATALAGRPWGWAAAGLEHGQIGHRSGQHRPWPAPRASDPSNSARAAPVDQNGQSRTIGMVVSRPVSGRPEARLREEGLARAHRGGSARYG